jgi:hypothetical protein
MVPFAHIAGIPVEETIGSFGPAMGAVIGALGVTVRARGRGLRRRRSRIGDARGRTRARAEVLAADRNTVRGRR